MSLLWKEGPAVTADPRPSPQSSVLQTAPSGNRNPPTEPVGTKQISRTAIWVRRASVLVQVVLYAVVGVLLVVLPWSLQWTANALLWGYPDLRAAMGNGFVRGVCSGIGILNLWIGFREAVHYHEDPIQ